MKPEPCPWCGTTEKRKIIGRVMHGKKLRVEHYCRVASILGRQLFDTEDEVIEEWNKRAKC